MTLFAGIFSRQEQHPLPESVCQTLKKTISRNADDEVAEFKDERSYFVKVDTGAFGEQGFSVEGGALSLLAGEPLLNLRDDNSWQSRHSDLALIHNACMRGETDVLRKAQGVFALVHYEPQTATLQLIADKLGLRPLYYWMDERYVVFASALRILESLAEIPKRMDVRAVTEMVGLDFALADRTPYAGISLLKAAEVVSITGREVSKRHYWRWDEIATSQQPESELLQELYAHFETAVARRNRNDTTTVAYLSGGLDSRCVVAALHSQHARVHTFNFARPDTQDQILGRDFARRVEAIHEEVPKEAGDHVPDYSSIMARVWAASERRREWPAERPSLIWSGEGGSVALGHVHLGREIVELMRAGRADEAIHEYLRREQVYIPPKLFRAEVFQSLAEVLNEGIREELKQLHGADGGRNFHLFLMLNDQRRKLSRHFENIDLHRLEFQLPFFDSDFLSAIIALPLELCLGHKFYTKWLACFHPSVTAVAWQAYPGHEPCPLPVPQGLAYQWDAKYQSTEHQTQKRRISKQVAELLKSTDFPHPLLSKNNLRLAAIIHSTGWRDYDYMIKAACTYHAYWKRCAGEYALPPVAS